MLGTPAEIYRYGIQWIWSNVGFFYANLLAVAVMVPLLHPLKLTSANELLFLGIVLYVPDLALEADFPISGHEYVWKYTWNDWVLRRFNVQCFSQSAIAFMHYS
uniref:Uncharacterized protein n=1 Tax=Magallana gigas TaxID=29159 RepID=K1QQP9_MAGGI